jgi:tetratricopeptide (TPR) repeat protein
MKKYYKSSFWLFKQSPLFGTGLWSYRSLVYDAQAEINKIDKDFFKNYPEPKPRRVHTDYLEILNDGGLVAAFVLALFLIVVMGHGWKVIKDEEIDSQDRIITAAAFCSVISIMLTNAFFFPFRINSTMFLTVLMMGLMEGLYLRSNGLVSNTEGGKVEKGYPLIPITFLVLLGLVWFTGIKPFKAEIEHFKYKQAGAQGKVKEAEKFILKAIQYNPHNSAYLLYASQLYMNVLKDSGKARDFIERAIVDFNGDITRWSIYHIKGLLKLQMGSFLEAKAAFEKSLYYNPTYAPSEQKLAEVNKVIKDHDKVIIKFR